MYTQKQIEQMIAATLHLALAEKINELGDYALGWSNYFSETRARILKAYAGARTAQDKKFLAAQDKAAERAEHLVALLGIEALLAVRNEVAAVLEREFPNDAGRAFAAELREVNPSAHAEP